MTEGRITRVLKFPSYLLAKVCGTKYWADKIDEIVLKQKWETSSYAACANWGGRLTYTGIAPKDYYCNRIKCKFGKYHFFIPENYDEMLTSRYGDYMTLPPENKRIYHHLYRAFRKEE